MKHHNPKKYKANRSDGFSLIEMSIIITVFAILSVSILSGLNNSQEYNQVVSIDEKLDKLDVALAFHLKHKGFMPCPASRTAAYGSANYGVSVSCAAATEAAAPAGTINIGAVGDAYQLRVGTIPTRSLGLPDEYGIDPWGNKISYVIIRSLGIDSASYSGLVTTQATDLFQIINRAGTVLAGATNAQIIRYAIISHGSDGKGAFNKNGLGISCSTTAADRENCNTTKPIIYDGINDIVATSAATYYNDYVRYEIK